ncbi:MAG: type II CAAX endopeptidase family protein [Candidatus Omnitrophica bacterium]|nr:type II CAAX endopeptidase family protein [Candidatus Omnitrophota bacterium]
MITKRNTYIILCIICLISLIFLQAILGDTPVPKELKLDVNKEKLIASPYAYLVSLFAMFYLALILAGVANLILFIARKIRNLPFIEAYAERRQFPLSEERASKLLFYILAFVLLAQFSEIFIYTHKKIFNTPGIFLLLNFALEVGVSLIVIKHLSSRWLDFHCKKKDIAIIFRVYSSMLVFIIAAAIFNNFLLEKIGIKAAPNPAITFFLNLKSKPLIVLLLSQVVLIGPLAEELFFRGFIYKLLRTKFNFLAAGFWTSSFFALLHRTPQDILPLFLISIILCYIYEKTQNILSPIMLHCAHNTLNISLLLLLKDFIKA